jgi:nitric oxide reductase large subunit
VAVKPTAAALRSIEMWSFWIMSIGMGVMVLALTGAGILQVWLQRMPTEGAMPFMAGARPAGVLLLAACGGGVVFLLGLLTYLYSFFAAPGRAEDEAAAPARHDADACRLMPQAQTMASLPFYAEQGARMCPV